MEWLEPFFQKALLEPIKILGQQFMAMLPNLVAMGIILIVSLILAWVSGQIVERGLRVIRMDILSQRMGFTAALGRGGVKSPPSNLAGRMVFWVVLSVGVVISLAVLHLDPVNKITESLLAFFPYIVTSIFIIIGGFLLSNFVSQGVLIAAVNAELPPARLLAACTRWGIQLAAIAMALEQLGIAETIVVVGFGITFGGVVLAAALAFGLGAKDLAKDMLEQRFSNRPKQNSPDDLRHL